MSGLKTPNISSESYAPQLIESARLIDFSSRIAYLVNQNSEDIVKLSSVEADIVRQFTGRKPLSEILENSLEQVGTIPFQIIYNLLHRLRKSGMLTQESAQMLRYYPGNENDKKSAIFRSFTAVSRWVNATFHSFQVSCRYGWLQFIVDHLTVPVFLVFWSLMAVGNLMVHPSGANENMLLGITVNPVSPVSIRYGSYAVTLITVWLVLSVFYSLKNFLSVCFMVSKGCTTVGGRFRLFFGLPIFDCNTNCIVPAGAGNTFRLFSARLLFPFLVAFGMAGFCFLTDRVPMLMLLSKLFLIIGFFSCSPVFPSDLSRVLYLLVPEAGYLLKSNRFLMKRFLREMITGRGTSAISDYYLLIALAAIVWLYLLYSILWTVIRVTLVHLLADISQAPLWGQLLIVAYISIITIPFIALIVTAFMLVVRNIMTAVRNPLGIMRKIAARLNRRPIPDAEQIQLFLRNIPLFAPLETEALRSLCTHLEVLKVKPGRDVITLGEKGDAFYIIVSGQVQVIKEDDSGEERIVEVLSTGDSFGEIALLESIPRTATIRTTESTLLFKLEKRYFDLFIRDSGVAKEHITDLIQMSRRISQCPLFSFCSPSQIHAVVVRMKRMTVETGKLIFSQDDEGDRFYLIEEGAVELERREMGKVVWSKKIASGDYFGEIALVRNISRTATARVQSTVKLLSLSREDFYVVVGTSLLSGAEIDTVAGKRLAELGRRAACVFS